MNEGAKTSRRTLTSRTTLRVSIVAVGGLVALGALGACSSAPSASNASSGSAQSASNATGGSAASRALAREPAAAGVAAAPAGSGNSSNSGFAPAAGTGSATGSLSASDQAASAGSTGQASQANAPAGTALADRSIIRTAAMTVRVHSVLESSSRVSGYVVSAGGFVSQEQELAQPDHPDRAQAVITIRIPSSQLSTLLTQIGSVGTLISQQQSSEDVTSQVVDVQARLKSAQASVIRVQALMGQATSLGQVLEIENALSARQANLESLEAQSKALADETALATVTATLVGPKATTAKPKPVPAATGGFGHGISQGWHAFVTATTWILTGLGAVLPFLILAIPLAIGAVAYRRRSRLTAGSGSPSPVR
jgi:hypothetical protein